MSIFHDSISISFFFVVSRLRPFFSIFFFFFWKGEKESSKNRSSKETFVERNNNSMLYVRILKVIPFAVFVFDANNAHKIRAHISSLQLLNESGSG